MSTTQRAFRQLDIHVQETGGGRGVTCDEHGKSKVTLSHKDFIRHRILPISVNHASDVPCQNTHHLPRYFAPGVALKHDWCVLINSYLLRSVAHAGSLLLPC